MSEASPHDVRIPGLASLNPGYTLRVEPDHIGGRSTSATSVYFL
jgi:hypothetical protein